MRFASACVVLCLTAGSCSEVLAQQMPEPILWGWGEKIKPIQDLPPNAREQAKQALGKEVAVGYHYKHFCLFGEPADVWTWGGQYVLFRGNNYWPTSPAQLEPLLGAAQARELRPPWQYRFPPGLIGFTCLGAALAVFIYVGHRRSAQKILEDGRMREALQSYAMLFQQEEFPPGESEPTAEEKRAAMQEGVDFLVEEHEIEPAKAEAKLRRLITEIERDRSNAYRYPALEHEQAGRWDEAQAGFERALLIMQEWDPADAEFLKTCVQRVRKKREAKVGPEKLEWPEDRRSTSSSPDE